MSGPISAAPAEGDGFEGQQPSRDDRGDSAENNDGEPTRLACSECRRRKQGCNKQWPCQQCTARGQETNCSFASFLDGEPTEESRARITAATTAVTFSDTINEDVFNGDNDEPRLEHIGYSHQHAREEEGQNGEKEPECVIQDSGSPGLDRALEALPSRQCIDILVDHFLETVNNHPYVLHPTVFRREYEQWRDDRDSQKPLGSQWTSLLLMVCACTAQRSNDALCSALEADQGKAIHELSESYHDASHKLHSASHREQRDLHSLQQVLLSCFWYLSESRYSECRSELDNAFHVIKQLGINCEATAPPTSEYETEMRRRAWATFRVCDLNMVDLLRCIPVVKPGEYDNVQLPRFQLDGDLKESHPSPGLYTALQWELMRRLESKFGWPCTLDTTHKVVEHKAMVEQWIKRLPPHLALFNADTSLYSKCPLFRWQQSSLSTISQSMVWRSLRPYLVKSLPSASHVAELQLKHDGVDYSLKYLGKLIHYLKFVLPKHRSQFRMVVFFIFDVSTVISSTLLHEIDLCKWLRKTCLDSIGLSVGLLEALKPYAPVAEQLHSILDRIYEKVLSIPFTQVSHRSKRQRTEAAPSDASPIQVPYARVAAVMKKYRYCWGIPEGDASPEPQNSRVIPPSPADNGVRSVPSLIHVAHTHRTEFVGMQAGQSLNMPQHDDCDMELADVPCLSTSGTDVDENDLVSTPVDVSEDVEFSSDVSTEDDLASGSEESSDVDDVDIFGWTHSHVNLDPESLSPL